MFSKIAAGIIGTVAFIAVITVIFGSWYTVDQGSVGVLLRNGAVVGMSQPGLHFKTPWIESVIDIETRQTKWTNSQTPMEAYSKDLQPAKLRVTITYSVNGASAADLYGTFGAGFADKIIIPALYSAVKIVFGHYDASTAISNRGQMVVEMKGAVQNALQTQDIRIDSFQLEDVEFSAQFVEAVEQRMKQEIAVQQFKQTLLQKQIEADITRTSANGRADATRAQAKAEADATLLQAQADAQKTKLLGDAQAEAIKARATALGLNPGLVALTAAERWDGKLPASMVPNGAVPFVNLTQSAGVP